MRSVFFLLLLASVAACAETPVTNGNVHDEKALWEAGILGGIAYLPDYPASSQNHPKWIVAPYLIYRGNVLRADREGARARLLRKRYADLEMSFSGSFATRSKDNDARRNMPDLDYLLETGPRLSIPISDMGGRGRLRFFWPVRAVLSSNFKNLHHRGWTTSPALYARFNDLFYRDWIGVVQLTSSFGNRSINAYFYDVAPEFSTPQRPFYDAHAGYIGSDFFAGLAVPVGRRWRLFTGAQTALYEGSANQGSPLFRRNFNYTLVFGVSCLLFQSRRAAAPL